MKPWSAFRGAFRHIAAAIALAATTAFLLTAVPAASQDAAGSYQVGEHVEVKPTTWQDVWEEGVITSIIPPQLIIRSPTAGERAFNIQDVRHMGAGASANGQAGGGRQPAPQAPQATNRTPAAAPAGQGDPRIGQRVSVEAGGSCCYNGTVIGVAGPGPVAGYLLIHYDNPASHDAYARPDRVHPLGGGARAGQGQPAQSGHGHTRCVMSYGGPYPVCLPVAAPG